MDYAIVKNGTVTNVISLLPRNAAEFPEAVPLEDIPTAIGDSYDQGIFFRAGEPIKGLAEVIFEVTNYKALYEVALADINGLASSLSALTSFLPDGVKDILKKYEEETA